MSWLAVLGWTGLAALVVTTFLAALGSLNQTLYGASNFIERYLEAIADDDLARAAATPGVALDAEELAALGLPADVSTAMQRSGVATAAPEDIEIVEDVANDDGTRSVTASYRLEAAILTTTFQVRPIDPLYGVLNRWEFAVSPIAVVDVTAAHNPFFTVGTLTLDTRARKTGEELAAFDQTAPYLVVAPAVYSFAYDDVLLTAQPVDLAVEPSTRGAVTVDSQATPAFVERVQSQLNQFLDDCATQPTLFPTDCPFGVEIDDRVLSDPSWSISAYPIVTLIPGEDAFEMPPTAGVAHLSVELQSLFDGDEYTLEEDRTFTISLDARIRADGSISVQLK
ncbi:hypothetical protein GE115_04050 [Agromyces sp. CFH 90414]|uniref:Uncharacterized protein n=1 Tax=Agromyces agglutinans TaxID=2662258 RepID=A0A6I2F3S0_9MICO|nr:hypothetical protein [Agromyces agglutinans]MRG59044.1 hypothetical protein [Agromyces agglutinans]